MAIYFGGTLFEAFLIRNQFDDYINVCKEFGVSYMEVSDGSITIPHAEKCGYIEKLTKHDAEGWVALGFGLFFFVLIVAAYFLYIK